MAGKAGIAAFQRLALFRRQRHGTGPVRVHGLHLSAVRAQYLHEIAVQPPDGLKLRLREAAYVAPVGGAHVGIACLLRLLPVPAFVDAVAYGRRVAVAVRAVAAFPRGRVRIERGKLHGVVAFAGPGDPVPCKRLAVRADDRAHRLNDAYQGVTRPSPLTPSGGFSQRTWL